MRILLAIDDSECSTAAVKAVIDQFRPAHTQITVLHADDWPEGMPPPMAFAEGSSAARSVLAFHKLRRSNAAALLESVAEQLRRRGFRGRGITARRRPATHHRPVCERVARRSHRPGIARQEGARPDAGQRLGQRGQTRSVLGRNRPRWIPRGVAGSSNREKELREPWRPILRLRSRHSFQGQTPSECLPVPSIGSRPTSASCGWWETALSS